MNTNATTTTTRTRTISPRRLQAILVAGGITTRTEGERVLAFDHYGLGMVEVWADMTHCTVTQVKRFLGR